MIPSQRTPHEQMIQALLVERFGSPVVKDWKAQKESELGMWQRMFEAGLLDPDEQVAS